MYTTRPRSVKVPLTWPVIGMLARAIGGIVIVAFSTAWILFITPVERAAEETLVAEASREFPPTVSPPTASPPTPTLAPTLPPTPEATATPTEALPVALRVVAVGDMMLGRMVNIGSLRRNDFTWPFQQTAAVLQDADLTLGNLEGAIVEGCPLDETANVFCADPRAVEGLVWAGFDGVSLANNHAHDRGDEGFSATIASLEEAGIAAIDDSAIMIRDVQSIRVGVIGLNDVSAPLDLPTVLSSVEDVAHIVDVLIGLVHWGDEYVAEPTARQREVGQALIDAGMHVVIGSHPHWVQPAESYRDGVIFYSLGNFIFDQMWSEATCQGEIVRLTLIVEGKQVRIDYQQIPVEILNFGQPRLVTD